MTATAPAAAPSNWFRAGRRSSASAVAAFADEVEQTTETVSAPVLGNQTAAGLPSRLPGANMFSGPAASGRLGSPSRRSAEQARNRLGGFQLGSRQAEGQAASEGEGS
jgi:hypothetical protein